jgi:hypothetical protein
VRAMGRRRTRGRRRRGIAPASGDDAHPGRHRPLPQLFFSLPQSPFRPSLWSLDLTWHLGTSYPCWFGFLSFAICKWHRANLPGKTLLRFYLCIKVTAIQTVDLIQNGQSSAAVYRLQLKHEVTGHQTNYSNILLSGSMDEHQSSIDQPLGIKLDEFSTAQSSRCGRRSIILQ